MAGCGLAELSSHSAPRSAMAGHDEADGHVLIAAAEPPSDPLEFLPSSEDQFRSKQYWDDFFAKRTGAFEWYGEWNDIKMPLTNLFDLDSSVLVLGCGNSALSQHMYDHGFHAILNIDYSKAVIRDMAELNKSRTQMQWVVADARETGLEVASADLVIDKGTLDAMLPVPTEEAVADATKMIGEACRVLRSGGAYVCVSLLQSHVLELLVSRLGPGWDCHVAPFHPEAPSPLCPFIVVAWKYDTAACSAAEASCATGAASSTDEELAVSWRFHENAGTLRRRSSPLETAGGPASGEEEAVTRLDRLQQLLLGARLRFRTQVMLRATKPGQRVSFDLFDARGGSSAAASGPGSAAESPRFTLTAVDSSTLRTCCALVVPRGREADWMFASEEGQAQLGLQTGMGRLVLVRCNRGHAFGDEAAVREEVAAAVMGAAPAELEGQLVWLGVASDDDVVVTVAELESELSGRMSVEEVHDSAETEAPAPDAAVDASAGGDPLGFPRLRRLVFFSNQGAVQSEARVLGVARKTKRRARKAGATDADAAVERELAALPAILQPTEPPPPVAGTPPAPLIDFSHLAFEYHQAAVACLAVPAAQAAARCAIAAASAIPRPPPVAVMNVCILGLGGGGLTMFLHRAFGAGSGIAVPAQAAEAAGGASKLPAIDPSVAYGVLPTGRVMAAATGTGGLLTSTAAGIDAASASSGMSSSSSSPATLQLVPPPLRVHALELDPTVAAAARDFFGFTHRNNGGRCALTIGDGLRHVMARAKACETASEALRQRLLLDALVIDVDAKDVSSGLSFPPRVSPCR